MAGANHREAGADDRAEAGAGGQVHAYRELAAAFERVADASSLLVRCPGEPETEEPSLEEPWDVRAADELARLYASGDADLARPLSSDTELQARLVRIVARAAALRPPAPASGSDREGIEARLAEMAHTIETALAKIHAATAGSAHAATPTDAGGLKLVEAHTGELLANAQQVRTELGRLTDIEAQLGEIKASLSEGRIAGFIQAVMPTEDELSRLAEAAARKAIRERPEATGLGDQSATARLNERSSEIQRVLTGFVDEHRQSEQQVAEALETMQQAMQHILDRIDAIEGAQAAALEALPEDLQHRESPGHTVPTPAVGSVHDARARAGFAAARAPGWAGAPASADDGELGDAAATLEVPAWAGFELGDHRMQTGLADADASGDRDVVMVKARLAAEMAAYEDEAKPFPGRADADGRSALRPGILVAASLAAFLLAGYWLVSGPRLRLPDGVGTQSTEQQHPGETAPVVRPALRSFSAGPDVDSGGSGQRAKDAVVPGAPDQAIEHTTPGWRTDRGGDPPETQAQRTENGTAATAAPAGLDRWTAPGGADVLQGPVGVVIEQGRTALSPEDLLRLRQRQRMANLSTRLGQQAGDTAQPVAVWAGDAAARQQDAPGSVEARQQRVSVELPPLMIGPHSLRHAAANGDASAQLEVAARFAEGKGVKQDFAQAAAWYQRAATQGLAAAQYRLAALYERGIGVTADQARAKAWYKRAAEQGNLKAMHNLAVLSAGSSEGATADYATAGRWFGEAAAHGLADSQYNLGILHENGLGVAKDHAAAYKWYALAARSGDKEAVRRRELARERLGADALKLAEAGIAAWRAQPADQLANDARAAGQAWKARAAASSD